MSGGVDVRRVIYRSGGGRLIYGGSGRREGNGGRGGK